MYSELPERVDLAQLKTQAKDLLKHLKNGERAAVDLVLDFHPQFKGMTITGVSGIQWKIADAQYVLARKYGFNSWEKLKVEIERRADDLFNIRRIVPLITVSDIQKSLEFYEAVLGFHRVGQDTDNGRLYWCRLKKDGTQIMLQEDKRERSINDQSITLCFITKNVDRVYEQLVANGLALEKPFDAPYGMRQIFLKDPDQHEIWFESPLSQKDFHAYTE